MCADGKEMRTLLEKLMGFGACTTERANESLEYVAQYLRQHGLEPEIMENQGHKMLTCQVGQGSRCLLLNGHLDVVEGRPEQYVPRQEGDRLYGRGGYDMLGGCVVFIHKLCQLQKHPPRCRVVLSLSTTEETAGALCTGYMVEQGMKGDFAICGEPTNLAVSVMSKGVLRFKAKIYGRAAHSSRPWQGENALLKAYDIYQRLERLPFATRKNDFFDRASVNLSRIQGGVVMNQVPDFCEMVVDIRYLPGEDTGKMLMQIQDLDPSMELEVTAEVAAVETDPSDPCMIRLLAATEEATGQPAQLTAQHGAADTAFFQAAGIPSVEFGPCGAGHHGPEEYVELSSLETYLNCVSGMISRMED